MPRKRHGSLALAALALAVLAGATQPETFEVELWANDDRAQPARRYPDSRRRACPRPAAHRGSAYAVCAEFRDLGSGRLRLIQYEAPCT